MAAYVDRIKANGNWQKLKRKGFVKDGAVRTPGWTGNAWGTGPRRGTSPRTSAATRARRWARCSTWKSWTPWTSSSTREPVWRGEALLHDDGLHLVEDENGPLKLWFRPGLDGQPPAGRYVVAADPGTGIDSAEAGNSTLCGGDAATGEQILEFSKQLPEARLADLAVALAEWLADAPLIWEAQGPAASVCDPRGGGDRLLEHLEAAGGGSPRRGAPQPHQQRAGGLGSTTSRPTSATSSRISGWPCRTPSSFPVPAR